MRKKAAAEHTQEFREHMDKLKSLSLSPAIEGSIAKTQAQLNAYISSANEVVKLAATDPPAAEARLPAFGNAFRALETDMEQLSNLIEALAKETDSARAAGDLGHHIEGHTRDKTGHLLLALEQMGSSLANIVGQVRGSAEAIAIGSAEIATGSADLSQRTEEQASSLEETASAMGELMATVKSNAETAQRATELARSAATLAAGGPRRWDGAQHRLGGRQGRQPDRRDQHIQQ